ncbi:MAG: COX15/CtaA family protein [Oligoflexales bacterium]|nr:COX15/CtaA family protein [Oligoflexales bacterium]
MRAKNLASLALGQLVYLLAVILFGAYVRATGSGAGCGSHWPLCNGEVIPTAPQIKTIIEFSHRISSGLTLPLALVLFFLMKRYAGQNKRAIGAAMWTIFFLITEGLLGAGLVHFEHVAGNTSVYRAVSMSLHLINTFTLMAFASLTWLRLAHPQSQKSHEQITQKSFVAQFYIWAGGATILMLGVSGAITALGDTVFPVASAGSAFWDSFSPSAHLFVKLKIYHPFLAVFGAVFLLYMTRKLSHLALSLRLPAQCLALLVLMQLALGYANIKLFAPVWLQLTHLLFAELIWITYIVLAAMTRQEIGNSLRTA